MQQANECKVTAFRIININVLKTAGAKRVKAICIYIRTNTFGVVLFAAPLNIAYFQDSTTQMAV